MNTLACKKFHNHANQLRMFFFLSTTSLNASFSTLERPETLVSKLEVTLTIWRQEGEKPPEPPFWLCVSCWQCNIEWGAQLESKFGALTSLDKWASLVSHRDCLYCPWATWRSWSRIQGQRKNYATLSKFTEWVKDFSILILLASTQQMLPVPLLQPEQAKTSPAIANYS